MGRSLLLSRVLWVAMIAVVLSGASSAHVLVASTDARHQLGNSLFQTAWTTSMSHAGTVEGSNFTCRFVSRSTLSGDAVRVRVSNAMGSTALVIDRASVGMRASGFAVKDPPVPLTFGENESTSIPPSGDVLTDPASLHVPVGQDVIVSLYVRQAHAPISYHIAPLETNACTSKEGRGGDHTRDQDGGAFTGTGIFSWWVDALQVRTATGSGTLVALGDSITDGTCTEVDSHKRWTDELAGRLGGSLGVANEAISGNRLEDRGPGPGPGAVSRLQRDVLSLAGVTTLVLFEGTNDLAGDVDADAVLRNMRSIVATAHGAGIRVIGGTILPRPGALAEVPQLEVRRQEVNEVIRGGAIFDSYLDFDRVARSPGDRTRIDPRFDCDHTHPNAAGYAAMAAAVPLAALH